jgi:hypothetical protein
MIGKIIGSFSFQAGNERRNPQKFPLNKGNKRVVFPLNKGNKGVVPFNPEFKQRARELRKQGVLHEFH